MLEKIQIIKISSSLFVFSLPLFSFHKNVFFQNLKLNLKRQEAAKIILKGYEGESANLLLSEQGSTLIILTAQQKYFFQLIPQKACPCVSRVT
jgi:hypothetical protein